MFSQKEKSVIYEAFDMYYINYCKTIPSNEELSYITFTKDFEEKMQKLIESERKFYFYWINTVRKRVAIIILAIIISLTSVTFGVKAIREPVIRFIVETFEKFSNVVFVGDKSEEDEEIYYNFETINPSYIPNGYVLDSNFEQETVYQAVYINEQTSLMFMYMQAINNDGILQANTENVVYENILVNDYPAIYYFNKGTNTIILSGEKYIFTIEGTIEKEELIKIAESIEIK
mgnify:CR=1 FL=1